MDPDLASSLGAASVFVTLFLLLLAILWFFLPFAIFGTKDRLSSIISESKRTNAELAKITAELAAIRVALSQQHRDGPN